MKKIIILLLLWIPIIGFAFNKPVPLEQAFQVTAGMGENNTVLFHWEIDPSSYLYRDRITFKIISPSSVSIQAVDFPSSQLVNSPVFGKYEAYTNLLTIPVTLAGTKGKDVKIDLTYQGCSMAGVCYPPVEHVVTVNFTKGFVRIDTEDSRQSKIADLLAEQSLWLIILTFIGFGLLLAFTPCVLPMIPILFGIIVGHGKQINPKKAFLLSLVYVLAMSITYAVAGIIVALIGGNIQAALQTPWVIILFSLLFIALSLSLFGLYELQLPEKLRNKLMNVSSHQGGGSYLGVAAMGVLATLVVSPCVTPPLIGVLVFIANTGNVWLGGSALFALGIGMGIPLLIIGCLGGKYLPKSGPWMEGVKKLFGFMMILIAIYLLSRILPGALTLLLLGALFIIVAVYLGELWQLKSDKLLIHLRRAIALVLLIYGVLLIIGGAKGNTNPFQPLMSNQATNDTGLQFIYVNNVTQLDNVLANAKGKPVMLDFYAKWCMACKEMDATTFQNLQVQKTLSNFVLLRADVTDNSVDDKALAQQYGVVAPPSFVFFDKTGNWLPDQRIVGSMDAKDFNNHAKGILAGTAEQ